MMICLNHLALQVKRFREYSARDGDPCTWSARENLEADMAPANELLQTIWTKDDCRLHGLSQQLRGIASRFTWVGLRFPHADSIMELCSEFANRAVLSRSNVMYRARGQGAGQGAGIGRAPPPGSGTSDARPPSSSKPPPNDHLSKPFTKRRQNRLLSR